MTNQPPAPLALAQKHRYATRHEAAFQILDAALQDASLSPTDLNSIRLRKLDYQIEYFWLYNRLGAEIPALQTELDAAQADAVSRGDEVQIAYVTFLNAHLQHFYLFETSTPDLDAVEKLWIQAHELYARLQDERGMAESLFYHGLLYQRFKADQETAFTYFELARHLLFLDGKNQMIELAECLRHTGYVYQHRGDLETARVFHERALACLEVINFRVFMPLVLYALGATLMEQGKLDEALPYFERTLTVAQEAPPNILHVAGFLGLGDLYAKQGDSSRAHAFYTQAHETAEALHSTRFIKLATEKLNSLPA
jgi:tetratricopeptide (TPR) repeat protein